MNITSKGTAAPAQPDWWVGKEIGCTCGFRATLEEGDDQPQPAPHNKCDSEEKPLKPALIRVCAERRPGGKQWVEMTCPTCRAYISLTNVWPAQPAGAEFNPQPAKPLRAGPQPVYDGQPQIPDFVNPPPKA